MPDLQTCSVFGDTPAEALAEIEQAIEAWLAVAREGGLSIRNPATACQPVPLAESARPVGALR